MTAKTKIPGVTYIVIGVIVAGISFGINRYNSTNRMKFFFYVGILFLLIGLGKVLYARAMELGMPKSSSKFSHVPTPHSSHSYESCPRCGSKLRKTFNFCYNCGERLIHYGNN